MCARACILALEQKMFLCRFWKRKERESAAFSIPRRRRCRRRLFHHCTHKDSWTTAIWLCCQEEEEEEKEHDAGAEIGGPDPDIHTTQKNILSE